MSIIYDTMSIYFGNVIKLSLVVSNKIYYVFFFLYLLLCFLVMLLINKHKNIK